MRLLLACTCLTPVTLLLPLHGVLAETTVATARTTPIATGSANNGSADSVTITSAGSIKPTSGVAVTINSNHAVTNEGTIQLTDANNAAGIVANAGVTATITNKGSITLDEAYKPADSDKDGDLDGPLAQGQNRFGIRTLGAFNGSVVNTGTIAVAGNSSAGISLEGPLNGSLTHGGAITIVGDNSAGIRAGVVTGNVALTGSVSATGSNAVAIDLAGPIGGALTIQGAVSATGYRSTTAPADASKLDADDLLQGGPALRVAGSVAGGILFDAPPRDLKPDDKDEDKDGIEDAKEGTASVIAYGAAPAVRIGSASQEITIGAVAGTAAAGNGIVNNGRIEGNGVYKDVAATGMAIGGLGQKTVIAGGILNNGTIAAKSSGGNATALHIGSLATVPALVNSGTIEATGGNGATTQARAVVIENSGSMTRLTNSGRIAASAAADSTAAAIIDLSGKLATLDNSGTISATAAKPGEGKAVAIDLSANATGATVRQTAASAGAKPSITGDIRLGSGNDLVEVSAGSITGAMRFGAGNNRLLASGDAALAGNASFGSGADMVQLSGKASLAGALDLGGGADTLSLGGTSLFRGTLAGAGQAAVTIAGGTMQLTAPGNVQLASLAVSDKGTLGVTIDGKTGTATRIAVAGSATIAAGSKLAVNLTSIGKSAGSYQILTAGQLTGSANLASTDVVLPYLFTSTVTGNDAAGLVTITIKPKAASELAFSQSQARAYDAVFKALDNDADVAASMLATTKAEEAQAVMQQMLPDHAGGTFATVTQGSRATARFLTDPAAAYSDQGNWGFWLQQTVWGSQKDRGQTASFDTSGWGATGGVELKAGDFGNIGLSLAYLNGRNDNKQTSGEIRADQFELAAHWRGQWGPVRAFVRGSAAKVDFGGTRRFAQMLNGKLVERNAQADWSGDLFSASAGLGYEAKIGKRLVLRPTAVIDYYRLDENGYTETGGGNAFNLTVDMRSSDEIAVNGTLVAGYAFGSLRPDDVWVRAEIEGGRRQIIGGSMGTSTARFKDGAAFTLLPDARSDGWIGWLRLVGGQQGFTLAGEVGAEELYGNVALNARVSLRVGF
ncbi:autotransporter outer membrane beta-barrel domain-containing protein [Blastomonas sp. SL216]|uniref:autotransporter outer membrane beta-barrel domain-containing protein n=1 Tax=Blastomonas sp. SL216 TaxID=2995169 RepID=UPI002376DC81|nr:autotransporter domain-containing protein [Blastomonas sp. SL216]